MTKTITNWVTVTGDAGSDDCEVGCWVEGHWGQYGGDHLADKIDHILHLEPLDDPRMLREIADSCESMGYQDAAFAWWEIRSESIDKIVDRLNDATPEGHVWLWHDGEFFLSTICDDEENCTDETCAHWAYC